ncbi:MAG: hydrogenase formation protein HypD [Candidatus Odinarchaeota archaeon]
MKIASLDKFRDKGLISKIKAKIDKLATEIDFCQIMHVCGTHEMSLARWGVRSLLPENIRLIAGPGCPVCVTPASDVDAVISLSRQGLGILTFGDMLRVPSTFSSLSKEKGKGAEIHVVYGADNALSIARKNPSRNYIFFSPGFETTAPMTAYIVKEGLPNNLTVYSSHRLVPPAMEVLMSAEEVKLDGFILPGHVSTIIGLRDYRDFVKRHAISCVVAGFEPVDIFKGIYMLLDQVVNGQARVDNAYTRVVTEQGNKVAQQALNEVFEPVDASWRGLGTFKKSGLELREMYSSVNAKRVHEIPVVESIDIPKGCSCHKIMIGLIYPQECPLFMKKCRPEQPVGPCMVGSEGTCAIQARYSD